MKTQNPKENHRVSIGKRIKNLRKKNNFSQTYIAEKLFISQAAYSLIESSQNGIAVEHIITLSKLYDVTTDFILKGEKFWVRISSKNGFMPMVKATAHAGFINNLHEHHIYEETDYYRIPGYNPTKDHKLFEVEGESMSPTLLEGDVVICQSFAKVEHIIDGSLVLLVTNNGVYIKRIHWSQDKSILHLEADNANVKEGKKEIAREEVLQAMAVKGKISNILIPHHQIASTGKIQSLEDSIEFIKKELYQMNKKMGLLTK